jgi:gas vesicle structural protein
MEEYDLDVTQTEDNTVLELLDRLLHKGVVVCGDLAISVADVELIYARLQLTLSSVETARRAGWHVPLATPRAKSVEPEYAP